MATLYHVLGILCYTLGSLYYATALWQAWRGKKHLSE